MVHLDRSGASHSARTVESVSGSALRFLGYLRNVERVPGPSSLAEVLDGEALARYVAFLLTVRCGARGVALPPRRARGALTDCRSRGALTGSASRAAWPPT